MVSGRLADTPRSYGVGVSVVDRDRGASGVVVVVAGGTVAVTVVAGGTVAVTACPGTVVGTVDPTGAVDVAVVGTTGGGTIAAGGVVSTTAVGVVPATTPSSLVSSTKANASSAPASRMIAPMATVGSCQFGVGARRVRAGAPHSRHQSCSGPIVAEQRGQRSEPGGGSRLGPAGGCVLTGYARSSDARGGSIVSVGCGVVGETGRGCAGTAGGAGGGCAGGAGGGGGGGGGPTAAGVA